MTFLAILMALMIERYRPDWVRLRQMEWFYTGLKRIEGLTPPKFFPLLLGLWILLPALLLYNFGESLPWWVMLPLTAIVALMTLGARDLQQHGEAFVAAWEAGERQRSREAAGKVLGTTVAQSTPTLARTLFSALVLEAQQRFFIPVFWLALLGPAGAMLFRCAQVADQESRYPDTYLRLLLRSMAWPVALLTSVGFGLVGSMTDMLAAWQRQPKGLTAAEPMVIAAAMGACQVNEASFTGVEATMARPIAELLNLLRRALLLMLGGAIFFDLLRLIWRL